MWQQTFQESQVLKRPCVMVSNETLSTTHTSQRYNVQSQDVRCFSRSKLAACCQQGRLNPPHLSAARHVFLAAHGGASNPCPHSYWGSLFCCARASGRLRSVSVRERAGEVCEDPWMVLAEDLQCVCPRCPICCMSLLLSQASGNRARQARSSASCAPVPPPRSEVARHWRTFAFC